MWNVLYRIPIAIDMIVFFNRKKSGHDVKLTGDVNVFRFWNNMCNHPKFAKRPAINFMHSLEFPTTWMKIKAEYFSIRSFYLNVITVPSYG